MMMAFTSDTQLWLVLWNDILRGWASVDSEDTCRWYRQVAKMPAMRFFLHRLSSLIHLFMYGSAGSLFFT